MTRVGHALVVTNAGTWIPARSPRSAGSGTDGNGLRTAPPAPGAFPEGGTAKRLNRTAPPGGVLLPRKTTPPTPTRRGGFSWACLHKKRAITPESFFCQEFPTAFGIRSGAADFAGGLGVQDPADSGVHPPSLALQESCRGRHARYQEARSEVGRVGKRFEGVSNQNGQEGRGAPPEYRGHRAGVRFREALDHGRSSPPGSSKH